MLFSSKFRHLLLINRSHTVERRPAVLSLSPPSVHLSVSAQLHTDSHINGMALGAGERNLPVKHPHHFCFFTFFLHSCVLDATSCSTPISKFPFYPHEKPHPISQTHTHKHTRTSVTEASRCVCDKTHTGEK